MRLLATIVSDLRLQWRSGFYAAAGLVAIVSIGLVEILPEKVVETLLPVIIFENVLTNSFYFVAGLVLLERGEGTRAAQAVTPLRSSEYVASKALTLAGLSLLESLAIAAFAVGLSLELLPMAIGVFVASVLFTLFGIALVCRHDSINEFLMPSVLYTFLLSLPILEWFGFGPWAMYAWHPLQGPLDLMGAWTRPLTLAHAAFAVLWAAIVAGPVFLWARRALKRSVCA